jgi:hypothetical protein
MDLGTYATLLNLRIIIPSAKGNYIAVERHFFSNCLIPLLEKVKVDENWYLEAYPDVRDAIASGVVPNVRAHYARFGFYEHRMPYRILVDEAWYLAEYADVRAAIAKKHFETGQAHFEADGFREGRFPYPNFQIEPTGQAGAH